MNLLQGDVLDAKAEAIILTVDGAAKGMDGNLSRQFASRWPDVWQEILDEIHHPIPLGKVMAYEPVAECAFQLIVLASTLYHREVLTDKVKQGIIREATEKSIEIAAGYGINTIATAVMAGGWRLKLQDAFLSMVDGYESARQNKFDTNLNIYILRPDDFQTIQSLTQAIGWR